LQAVQKSSGLLLSEPLDLFHRGQDRAFDAVSSAEACTKLSQRINSILKDSPYR
jgi:hypothetical protein